MVSHTIPFPFREHLDRETVSDSFADTVTGFIDAYEEALAGSDVCGLGDVDYYDGKVDAYLHVLVELLGVPAAALEGYNHTGAEKQRRARKEAGS